MDYPRVEISKSFCQRHGIQLKSFGGEGLVVLYLIVDVGPPLFCSCGSSCGYWLLNAGHARNGLRCCERVWRLKVVASWAA